MHSYRNRVEGESTVVLLSHSLNALWYKFASDEELGWKKKKKKASFSPRTFVVDETHSEWKIIE